MFKCISKFFLILLLDLILFLPLKLNAAGVGTCCNDDLECDRPLICTVYSGCSSTHGKQCMPPDCDLDNPCPDGRTCISGQCSRTDTPTGCTDDYQCAGRTDRKFFCVSGECMACRTDANCPERQRCDAGVCLRIETPSPCHPTRGGCSKDTDCADTFMICAYSDSERCFACLRRRCGEGEIVGNPNYCPGGRTCYRTAGESYCQQNPAAPPYFPESVSAPAAGQPCDEYIECADYGLTCKGDPPTCQPCSDNSECRGEPCIASRCGAAGYEGATYCNPTLPIGAQGCPHGQKCFIHGSMSPTCQPMNYCIDDSDCPPDTTEFDYKCEDNKCKSYQVGIPVPPTTAPAAPYVYEITPPELEIPLPTLAGLTKFLSARLEGAAPDRYLIIPWIGEYIAAAYKYAIGITGILAAIMIVIAGAIWLMAGGSAERVSTAKSFIENALVGLVIALTSYLLLYAINPKLTEFEFLKIRFIEREDETGQPVIIKVDAQGNITTTSGEAAELAATEGTTTTESTTVTSAATCTILYVTDTHHNPTCFREIATAMLGEPNVDMIIMGGDILVDKEATGDQERLWSNQWDQASRELREKFPDKRGPGQQKLFAAQGNHDLTAPFTTRFGANLQKATCGNVDFFLFPWSKPPISQLESQLNASTAQWKVVVSHLPFYACREGERVQPAALRNVLITGGVKLVLTGDTHLYCDGTKDDIRFIIGGTGGPKWRACINPPSGFTCESGAKLTYFRIEFGSSIDVQRKTLAPPSGCTMYEAH